MLGGRVGKLGWKITLFGRSELKLNPADFPYHRKWITIEGSVGRLGLDLTSNY